MEKRSSLFSRGWVQQWRLFLYDRHQLVPVIRRLGELLPRNPLSGHQPLPEPVGVIVIKKICCNWDSGKNSLGFNLAYSNILLVLLTILLYNNGLYWLQIQIKLIFVVIEILVKIALTLTWPILIFYLSCSQFYCTIMIWIDYRYLLWLNTLYFN